jgi:hypothetical protein
MSDSTRQRVVQVLSAPSSPLREEGVRLFVDHALAHKLRDAVDLQDIHALVLTALTRDNLERIVTQHVQPGWQRYSEHAPSSDALVGDLVPPEARAKLIMLAEQLRLPRAKWVQGCVDPALVRRLLGPVWVKVLLNFTKRLPLPGLGTAPSASAGSRGLAGMLGRSVQQQAGRFVDAGRSVMEGLGIDVEKKLLTAARDFSDSALAVWSEAMRERLASDEGRTLLAQINTSVVDHVLRTEFRHLQLDAAELPIERVHDLLPELVAHAARSKFVRDIVHRELAAYLAVEGDRSVGELVAELGVLDEARALLVAKGDELMRTLSESAAFSDWLTRLLDA